MKTLTTSPHFGTTLPSETAAEKAARLYVVADSCFGGINANSEHAASRILALCRSVVPGVQPDIPLRYALSILYRLHKSNKSFSNPAARVNMPFANQPLDLRLGNLKPRIEEIMLQHEECNTPTWVLNVCMCIELIWSAEGFGQRIEVIDYGNGYLLDATGIAIDLAREQLNHDPESSSLPGPQMAVNLLVNALTMLMTDDSIDFTGTVSDQFRAWCSTSIKLDSPAYAHVLSIVASKIPLLLVRG